MAEDAQVRVREAASAALGALIVDADVTAAHAIEGGALNVTRRGRRERLDAGLDDELWDALRAAGAEDGPLLVDLAPHSLRTTPVAGGRLLLHLDKAPPATPRLGDLVEERVLPEAAAEAVLSAAIAGNGLLALGPARATARRLAVAVAREIAEHAPVFSLSALAADWLLPAPALPDLVARARSAADLGAEALLVPVLSVGDVVALARARLPVAVIGAVDVANVAALHAAVAQPGDDLSVDAVAAQLCVVGRTVSGRAALLEQYAPAVDGPAPPAPAQPPSAVTGPLVAAPAAPRLPDAVEPARRAQPAPALPAAPPFGEPEAAPLAPLPAGPPADWASTSPGEDPGWELGDRTRASAPAGDDDSASPGGFDEVLAGVRKRPAFQPRKPPAHPQARELQGGPLGDPLGGLTLEPPPGGDLGPRGAGPDEGEDG